MKNVWEENIYSKNKQLNKYPYGELVSVFYNSLKYIRKSNLKILELGCGAGNNLWFFAELGHKVFGIDGSISAVKHARMTLDSRGVYADVRLGYFDNLPYEDSSMDIVIDRESIYASLIEDINLYLLEVSRVLKPGGIFITFRFSENDPNLKLLLSGKIKGNKIEKNTWSSVSDGPFAETGIVHFSSYEEMLLQHDFLEIKYLNEHNSLPVLNNYTEVGYPYCEYILMGVKK
jgi:ubiquinone/menaquinone biosynthesis C-methylase UbiE